MVKKLLLVLENLISVKSLEPSIATLMSWLKTSNKKFSELDPDGSGFISREEVGHFLENAVFKRPLEPCKCNAKDCLRSTVSHGRCYRQTRLTTR